MSSAFITKFSDKEEQEDVPFTAKERGERFMTSFPLSYKLLQTIEPGREDENTIIALECRQWPTARKNGTIRNGISIGPIEMLPVTNLQTMTKPVLYPFLSK
jgi:hypothetical protein